MDTQAQVVSIYRDSFARGNVVRETVPKSDRGKCAWCGQPARFRYGWEDDSRPRPFFDSHQFCGRDCSRSYWGH